MTELQIILISVIAGLYLIFGATLAAVDISNKEITLPHDFKNDGYNWFGSWTIFLFRTILAFPFWILFTLLHLIYKFIMWLFTVKGNRV